MLNGLPYKTKQFFFVLIKLSIVVGAFYFIYKKLVENNELDFRVFIDFLNKNDVFSLKNIVFLLFLSLFNWFFEILKWQKLVSSVQFISFKNALEQSLGALTASLFTPNRIGEYGAKAIYYVPSKRKRILLLNLFGNMSQMFTTIIFGVIGMWFFISKYNPEINYYRISRLLIVLIMVTLFIGFGLTQNRFKIKGFSVGHVKEFIVQLPSKIVIYSLLLSMVRYLVFSFQFYFILQLFVVDITYFEAMVIITSMYLLSSVVPSIFIFDVVIKGSIAVFLFTMAGVNELTVLCVVMIMWLFNFVIPSVFGSYYVLNFNLPKDHS